MRSLVVKIYLFTVVTLALLFLANLWVTRLLMDRAKFDAMRQVGLHHAGFMADEIARSLVRGPAGVWHPDPGRIAELGSGLMVRIRYMPWAGVHPPQLATRGVLLARRGFPLSHYWVRIDRGGKPVGAALVVSRFPHGPPPNHFEFPLLIVVFTGVLIVPSLLVWVVRPLEKMVAVAHRLGEGDLDSPVEQTRRDEFGDLERAFEGLRLRIQQMLRARDRLLTDISHELRGPLSRMTVALPLLKTVMPAAGPAARYVDQIEHEVGRMEALIEELLAFARGRSPAEIEQRRIDLAELARQLVSERSLMAGERGVKVNEDLEEAQVVGDPALLARAMGNFLDNALKYTPAGGHVWLETRRRGSQILFSVKDDGPGIPAAALAHLFEPFYRPDVARSRDTGGVGMGLAIARAIAERHGGAARVSSTEGEGTVAELALPAQLI